MSFEGDSMRAVYHYESFLPFPRRGQGKKLNSINFNFLSHTKRWSNFEMLFNVF